MDDNGGGRRVKSGYERGEEDRLSDLPESLLFMVLLNLDTKDVVKCSVLSTRWRNLWKIVPGLDLDYRDFREYDAFVGFVDTFLCFNAESRIQNFKLCFNSNDVWLPEVDPCTRWINTVVKRKVQHLHVIYECWEGYEVEIPATVYTCESLVSLKIFNVVLADTDFVSLPCVRNINLDEVKYANDTHVDLLISGCPVLESLTLSRRVNGNVQVLRVCSQSLLRFSLYGHFSDDENIEEDRIVEIDAPLLVYLEIADHETDSFIINNMGSLVKADISSLFNFRKWFDTIVLQKRNMIRKFFIAISTVKTMTLNIRTLEVIYNYSTYERVPLFPNLSSLHVVLFDHKWDKLSIFLQSCPNLKSLTWD